MAEINLTTTQNVKLKTAGKYCDDDITIKPTLQSKIVQPVESKQVLNVDDGYSGMDKVEIGAISPTYVGSEISRLAERTYTPTTIDQEIASGQFLDGKQVIKGDTNFRAENIAKDVTLFGLTGTHQGGIIPSGTLDVNSNGIHDVTNYESVNVNVASSGGGDLTETNRQLVMMSDLQNSVFKGNVGFNESIYSDLQLEYIQELFNYINRGVTA